MDWCHCCLILGAYCHLPELGNVDCRFTYAALGSLYPRIICIIPKFVSIKALHWWKQDLKGQCCRYRMHDRSFPNKSSKMITHMHYLYSGPFSILYPPIQCFHNEACSFYMDRVDQHVPEHRLTKFYICGGQFWDYLYYLTLHESGRIWNFHPS